MKRGLIYILVSLLIIPIFIHAQTVPETDSNIRKRLNAYLHRIQATENRFHDTVNLKVWNLLTNKTLVDDRDADSIGIYGFYILGSHQNIYILLKYHNEYEIFEMTAGKFNEVVDYLSVLQKLISYFTRHPQLDKRLYPSYNKAIYDVYVYNTSLHQLGPWFEWYETDQRKYTEGHDIDQKPRW